MAQSRFYVSSAFPTTLPSGCGASGNIQVAALPGTWPASYPYTVLLDWGLSTQEAVSVTGAPTGGGPFTLPCTRGIDGTTAQSHATGALAAHGVSAQDFTQWSQFIDGLTGTAASNFDAAGAAAAAQAASLAKASNLSDLASAGTARTNLGLGTAATQASSAFDAAGAATAAQAAAIAASLPTLTAATASASATLAINKVTQVTAASNLTMTLPTPVAGALIVVERESASAGTVTVSGSIRGSAGTVVLSLAAESEMFLGTASTWDPVAGHKTLTSLDARYGQLATASKYTADQYFGSGRPWFDLVAFGADPTGATDSTLAITTAINTAMGLRTDTGVGMTATSTTVTDTAAVSGDSGKYVNHPNFPLGCSLISSVTPGVGYTVATAATATLTGQTASIGTGSTITSRSTLGPVFAPSGTYKVTSDLLIQSVAGFQLIGAGANNTTFKASGTGFTTAVLSIDGALDGVFAGFTVNGDGTEGAGGSGIPAGINLTGTTSAHRSTSANTFRNIRVRSLNFVAGISLAGVASRQLDGTLMHDVVISGQQTLGSWSNTGNWQQGFVFGNGTAGNNLDHAQFSCGVNSCYYGWDCNNSGFSLHSAQPSSNGCDFHVMPAAQITISNIQSQNAGQLLLAPATAAIEPCSMRDVSFGGFATPLSAAGTNWVQVLGAGGSESWILDSILNKTAYSSGSPVMSFNCSGGSTKEQVTLRNIRQAASPSSGITVTGGGSILALNYIDTSTSPATAYPFWMANGALALNSGLAGATHASRWAGATTSGPPASGTFALGDFVIDQSGSIWICTTAGTVGSGAAFSLVGGTVSDIPADIQWFNGTPGTFTWTKPANAQTVYALAVAGGSGGGSGRSDVASTVRCGGGGGGGGGVVSGLFAASDLASALTVTVGAGGAGGASVTGAATSGNNGTAGGASRLGAILTAPAGSAGKGGTATSGAAGSGGLGLAAGGAGGIATAAGGNATGGGSSVGPNGGGGGGGITTGNVAGTGANSAATYMGSSGNNGTGGTVDTAPPGGGAVITVQGTVGTGGGGGAASVTTDAQAGATALGYGGGGGGGGGALSTFSSGAGGAGGQGYVLVITHFA